MKKFIRTIRADSLLRQSGMIFSSTALVNVFNLAFWLFMVRQLTPKDYGALNALLSLLMLFSMPLGVVQTVVTRYVSKLFAGEKRDQIKSFLASFLKMIRRFSFVTFFILLLGSARIASFLRLEETWLVAIVGLGIIFSAFSSVSLGALTGLQRFKELALAMVGSGFAKLIFGVGFVALHLRVFGGLLGFVISFLITFWLTFFFLPAWAKGRTAGDDAGVDKKEISGYFLPVGVCLFCFYALTNSDVILVKHFFEPVVAGYYCVAQMVGKIVLFIPGAISVVMFPRLVNSHELKKGTQRTLVKSLGAVGVLCVLACSVSILFPSLILRLLTGSVQPVALGLVKYFAVAMSFFALVQILMYYHLAHHNLSFIKGLAVVTFLQVAGIWFIHSSLKIVLVLLVGGSSLLFAFGMWSVNWRQP